MLEYLTEIIQDANDFGWQPATTSQAVLLCMIEDGRLIEVKPQNLKSVKSSLGLLPQGKQIIMIRDFVEMYLISDVISIPWNMKSSS